MDTLEVIVIVFVSFFSALIKNGVGVGAGIFLLPTLALVFPAKVALGLGAPIMLGSDIAGLRYYWGEWRNYKELLCLICFAVPGMLLGTWLIPIIPSEMFQLGVGIFGMSFSLCLLVPALGSIFAVFRPKEGHNKTLVAFFYGFFAGMVTVLAHAGGLIWSIYLLSLNSSRRVFVGTLLVLFTLTNIYKTGAYMYIGILTVDMLIVCVMVFPILWFGSYVGNICNKKLNQDIFRKILLVIIFLISASLTV